jgi:hypothetical protein
MVSSKNFLPKSSKLGFFFPKTSFGQFTTPFFVAKWQNFATKKTLVVGLILGFNTYFSLVTNGPYKYLFWMRMLLLSVICF